MFDLSLESQIEALHAELGPVQLWNLGRKLESMNLFELVDVVKNVKRKVRRSVGVFHFHLILTFLLFFFEGIVAYTRKTKV